LIKFFHEIRGQEFEIIKDNALLTWDECARFFPQPDWCGHPNAVRCLPWGCGLLISGRVQLKYDCQLERCKNYRRVPRRFLIKMHPPPPEATAADLKAMENMTPRAMYILTCAIMGQGFQGVMTAEEAAMVKNKLINAIDTLSPIEQRVIGLRFGLIDGRSRTFVKVAEEYGGVTRERIRQVEAKALRKLRHPTRTGLVKRIIKDSPSLEWCIWPKELHITINGVRL